MMNGILKLSLAAGIGALSGCASMPPQKPLSLSNPANPEAEPGVYPVAKPVLMTGTNYALPPEPAAGEMRQHHRDSMPPMESMPAPGQEPNSHGEQP